VWFGWTNYDSTSTGLGRLDLKTFIDDLTPAYASDLMATGQGTVTSVVTYLGKRWFTATGLGAYRETTSKVASGTVVSGRITYGLPDTKTAVKIDVRHDPLPAAAEVQLLLSVDSGTPGSLGVSELDGSSVSPVDAFNLALVRGTHFDITTVLTGDLTLRRITLQVDPAAERSSIISVPLQLRHRYFLADGSTEQSMDVTYEYGFLIALWQNRSVVNYQENGATLQVVLDDYTWRPDGRENDYWDGTFIARLKEL
jgi:hypothetical protein